MRGIDLVKYVTLMQFETFKNFCVDYISHLKSLALHPL